MALYEVLALLLPIGIYCLLVAAINRRAAPLVVAGLWDTIGILFAASGFFLITIPMLLTEFYLRSLNDMTDKSFFEIWLLYWFIFLLYYVLVIIGSIAMISWRVRKTMIYNVDADLFMRTLNTVFAPLGLGVTTRERHIVIAPLRESETQDTGFVAAVSAPTPADARDKRHATVEVDSFPALCHVTLHWDQYTPNLRQDIEKELQKGLVQAAPADNPAAGWFLSASGLIFGMIVMILVMVLFWNLVLLQRR